MAPVCISDERSVAVSAERFWKVFSNPPAMPKLLSKGDTRHVWWDVRTLLIFSSQRMVEVALGGAGKLKTHLTETKLEATGAGSCMAKLRVECEPEDGGSLSPEKQKIILEGYFGMLKMIENYLVAHPAEYA
ncbi:hypothetical protein OsI_38686 [Oryza sativa Indica Group]|uniref:Bet v I/Major latex protein domain-containing protein n=1 Tax=Oryza sativa subsp. indica TaxID=39946 RepID=B8BMG0_ORYSI|nr:hypothetical protein OsI_38686 [Oryza sativa Indica Group]